MRLVYRVESETGKGPYRPDPGRNFSRYTLAFPDHEAERPVWNDARVPTMECHLWRFAFVSLAQLGAWFDAPRRARLAAVGYRVAVYQAETVLEDAAQCVMLKAASKRVGVVAWENVAEELNEALPNQISA